MAAAWLRLKGLNWDDYNHYHPDERYISWVGTTIEVPQSIGDFFEPHNSSFNPFYWPKNAESKGIVVEQDEPRRFAYGHLPLYLGVGATKVMSWLGDRIGSSLPEEFLLTQDILNRAGWIEYRHLTIVGRALAALADIVTVGLIYVLGKQLFGTASGLLAASFLALNVMHIQLAHFFAVDPFLTLFVVAAFVFLTGALKTSDKPRTRNIYLLLGAICVGLAIGTKFSAVLLLLPLGLSILIGKKQTTIRSALTILALFGITFLIFGITNPYAMLDHTCDASAAGLTVGPFEIPEISTGSCFILNLGQQGGMVRGLRDVPFVRQYLGTTPYLYFVEMQIRWGMGLLLGMVAFAGFIWGLWRVGRALRHWWPEIRAKRELVLSTIENRPNSPPTSPAELLVSSWTLPYFLITGAFTVKFIRYMQPLTPFLMIYGAALLLSIGSKTLRRVTIAIVVVVTGLYALSFVNIYAEPHPWIEASRWIYDSQEPGTIIVSETWDDPLPDNISVDGQSLSKERYDNKEVNWLSGTGERDNRAKIQDNLAEIASSDLVVISTNRNYGVIPRLPYLYPASHQYYQLLFDGSLGFELVYTSMRSPNLFGFWLKPESFNWPGLEPPSKVRDYLDGLRGVSLGRFDESFTVYDQPLVMIFENKNHLSVDEMIEMFDLTLP